MFYDLHLNSNFNDWNYLKSLNYSGFCHTYYFNNINDAFKSSNFNNSGNTLPLYSRCNINYSNKIDSFIINRIRPIYNIICIRTNTFSNLFTISKLKPDIVIITLDGLKDIKKSHCKLLKDSKLYIELIIKEVLYDNKRIIWMHSIRELLRYNCKKQIVISSGAELFTELKNYNDIYNILGLFIKNKNIRKQIINNSYLVLKAAAIKRYAANNIVVEFIEEGRFKRDFLLESQI